MMLDAARIGQKIVGEGDSPRGQTWGEADEETLRAEQWRMYSAPSGAALGWLLVLLFREPWHEHERNERPRCPRFLERRASCAERTKTNRRRSPCKGVQRRGRRGPNHG